MSDGSDKSDDVTGGKPGIYFVNKVQKSWGCII